MIMRGSIPRALTASGILVLLGLGLILLPMGTSWAQKDDPVEKKGPRDKGPRKEGEGDPNKPPPRGGDRAEIEKRLDEMEHNLLGLLHDLQDLRRDLGIKGKGRRPQGPPDGEGGPRKKGPPPPDGEDGPPRKKGPPPGDRKGPPPGDGEDGPPRKKGPPQGERKGPPPEAEGDGAPPPPPRRRIGKVDPSGA